jgi:outer membrane protein OmpA-like peptidoglycan-associated protein
LQKSKKGVKELTFLKEMLVLPTFARSRLNIYKQFATFVSFLQYFCLMFYQKVIGIAACLFCFFCCFFAQAQTKSDKKKSVHDFLLSDTSIAVKQNRLIFPNINKIAYYKDDYELALIDKYKTEGEYDKLYLVLFHYVTSFGIDNFLEIKDMDLVWQLAIVSEKRNNFDLAKELYRLLLKHHRGDIKKAVKHYDSLTRYEKDKYVDIEKYYELVDLRRHIDTLNPPQGVLLNMGEEINSKFEDYGVTISRDNKKLIFTSKRKRNLSKTKDLKPKVDEDIYVADKSEGNYWEVAKPFANINSQYNEGSPCITDDGKMLIFARCYAPDGKGNCDLYVTYKENDSIWTEPENLGENINSYSWDSHPSLSVTEDTLFFASDRKGGFGGSDIYFSVKDRWGNWSEAQNIGAVINSQKDEVSPFMHAIYGVLYFSSNGQLINFGDFDIYKSYLTKTGWSEPQNIGPLVNGVGSEVYFTIDSKSEQLYYSRSEMDKSKLKQKVKNSKKFDDNSDIFSFPLPMEAQPTATVKFTGRVTEDATGEVFEGIVSVIDLDDKIEVAPKYLRTDGSFQFNLINRKRYMLVVQGENFFRLEEIFFLDSAKNANVRTRSIKNVTFQSIEFDNGSANLKPEMENDLHLLIDFLVTNLDFTLKISGHTDAGGKADKNLELSQKRADAIKNYIISYGKLAENRVKAIGMGSKQPIISPEKTDRDKKINRRVEFELFRIKKVEKPAEGEENNGEPLPNIEEEIKKAEEKEEKGGG